MWVLGVVVGIVVFVAGFGDGGAFEYIERGVCVLRRVDETFVVPIFRRKSTLISVPLRVSRMTYVTVV